MKNTCYILSIHLIKMTFLTKCQVEDLVKMAMTYSNWPLWFETYSNEPYSFDDLAYLLSLSYLLSKAQKKTRIKIKSRTQQRKQTTRNVSLCLIQD